MTRQPPNNIAAARTAAEAMATLVTSRSFCPLQIGYITVCASLVEASQQLYAAAHAQLTPRQIQEVAERLADLAADTALLGNVHLDPDPDTDDDGWWSAW